MSQGGRVGSSAMDLITGKSQQEDSERLSAQSIGPRSNFNIFREQVQRIPTNNNNSMDTSPMTKTYALKSNANFKSKVNMKTFLLNNN